MGFLQSNNIIFKGQFGFQTGKSTEHVIIDIHSKIIESLNKKENPCCIFLDFAKAFDTVNHDILLEKLNHCGIRGQPLKWFESYIKERQQCVTIDNFQSTLQTVKCGVPQGSVLGPLLFLVYINDIANSSKLVSFHLFADDTALFFSHKNTYTLQETLNNELLKITNWLLANKLSLNVNKSNLIMFRSKNSATKEPIKLTLNDGIITEQTHAKYLGILIDNKLTWEHQIKHIDKKLTIGNALLAKLRHYVPHKLLTNLYNAFIQPHIDYGAITWGNSAGVHIQKLVSSQNKTMRILNFKGKNDPVLPLYMSKNILPVKDNIMYIKGKFMWKLIHKTQPQSIIEMFEKSGATRNERDLTSYKLRLPYQRLEIGLNFIIYSGSKLWNQRIPNEITKINTPKHFNSKLKKFLIDNLQSELHT